MILSNRYNIFWWMSNFQNNLYLISWIFSIFQFGIWHMAFESVIKNKYLISWFDLIIKYFWWIRIIWMKKTRIYLFRIFLQEINCFIKMKILLKMNKFYQILLWFYAFYDNMKFLINNLNINLIILKKFSKYFRLNEFVIFLILIKIIYKIDKYFYFICLDLFILYSYQSLIQMWSYTKYEQKFHWLTK
jgi:hypothetical protein